MMNCLPFSRRKLGALWDSLSIVKCPGEFIGFGMGSGYWLSLTHVGQVEGYSLNLED